MSKLIQGNPNEKTLMEGVQEGYFKAIASCAACNVAFFKPDLNGIDAKLGRAGTVSDVGFQLKSTTDWRFDGDDLVYDLDAKAYNHLIGYSERVPSFLGLMIYPPLGDEWHQVTEGEFFSLRHTMYWEFLGGRSPSANTSSVTIRIPRRKILTASWLDDLFIALKSRRNLRAVVS